MKLSCLTSIGIRVIVEWKKGKPLSSSSDSDVWKWVVNLEVAAYNLEVAASLVTSPRAGAPWNTQKARSPSGGWRFKLHKSNKEMYLLLQTTWDFVLGHEGVMGSPFFPVLFSFSIYLFFCLPFVLMDCLSVWVPLIRRYKTQPNNTVTLKSIKSCLARTVLFSCQLWTVGFNVGLYISMPCNNTVCNCKMSNWT